MSCCGKPDNQDQMEHNNQDNAVSRFGNFKSSKWMLLCCLIPLALVAILLLTRPAGTLSSLSPALLLLICPLLHLIIMPLMMRKSKNT